MAQDPDGCEYWLLPQFLFDDNDGETFAEFGNSSIRNGGRKSASGFGMDFKRDFGYRSGDCGSFGPQSDLPSPFEGSTETESDDDDYISELSRYFENKVGWALSGSPESKLSSALGGRCGCNLCSSRGSPNYPSREASPTWMNQHKTALNLLRAAAGEIARLRIMEEAAHLTSKNGGLIGHPRKPSPISVPQRSPHQNLTHLSYRQHLKSFHLQRLRQQQMSQAKFQLSQTEPMVLNRERKLNDSMGACPTLEQTRWKQEGGFGMRAVFLGNPGPKRECTGTGVFLPRGTGAPATPSKKPACSTVLLPERVVQALNLKLEAVDTPAQPNYSEGLGPDCEAATVRCRNGEMVTQQRRSVKQHPVVINQDRELQLPREWTY